MKISILFLLSLLISVKDESYSISSFLNSLVENGSFNVLSQIKCYYGTDVEIEFCKETF